MSKKVIECEYCHTLISEEDNKCPSCGANCSAAIKKYRKEQEKKLAEEKARKEKAFDDQMKVVGEVGVKGAKLVFVITTVIIIMFIVAAVFIFSIFSRNIDRQNEESINLNNVTEKKKQEKVTVGFGEKAETEDMIVLLDSYEKYAYYSGFYKNYNTPEGYQKVAFHFEIKNKKSRDLYLWSEKIYLTADDYLVDNTSLKAPEETFAKVIEGKANYEDISMATIKGESTLKGYVGFQVPKDKKNLVFSVGDYITITMENPVYSE